MPIPGFNARCCPRRLLRVALMLALALPATAQADSRPGPLEEVQVTAGRGEQTTAEVSAAVTVVGDDHLARAAPLLASDLLRGQPGAFVQQTTPGQGIPIVRGLKGSEVLHLVDGMRLNNALFRNAPNQYLALVDAYALERIEVVRGPSPALYGADAMGGVVQLVTRPPAFFRGGGWGLAGRARVAYRAADEATLTHFAVDAGRDDIALGTALSYQDVGDRRAGDGVDQRPSAYTAGAARVYAAFAPADGHELLLDAQYLRQPSTPRYDELVPGFGQSEPSSAVFEFEPNDRLFLHGRYRAGGLSAAVDELELHVGYQVVDDDRRTRDFASTDELRERNRSELLGFVAQGRTLLGERHRLTWGGELYLDEVSSSRTSTDIVAGESTSVASRFPDGSTMDSYALFVHDQIAVGDALLLDVGARYTSYDVSLPPGDGGIGAEVDGDDLTGSAGLVYTVASGVNLVANVGRGFRAPNVFDLGTLGPRPGNRFNIANPGLEPESVITVDAGVKYSGAGVYAELLLWRSDYRDKITTVLVGQTDAAGRDIVQSRNANEVELWGVEAGGRWLPADSRWELTAALNYTRGTERSASGAEQPADRVPPLNGRLGAVFRPRQDWWIEGELRAADGQGRLSDRDVRDPRIDPAGTPGWAVLDLRAGRELGAAVSVGAGVGNLFDRRYREHGSGIDAPGRSLELFIEGRF